MALTPYYRTSAHTIRRVTALFQFVWPTAAALWNLRWQVSGFLAASPETPEAQLTARFIEGSGLKNVDLRTACLRTSWEEQQSEFAGFILLEACALFEGWIDAILDLLDAKTKANSKGLQFPASATDPTAGYASVLAKLQKPDALGNIFHNALRTNPKNSPSKLQNLLLCYRFFKECRNDFAHNGRRASQKTCDAYLTYSSLDRIALGLKEAPQAPEPRLDTPLTLSLRGAVGFTDVVLRLIATLDSELASHPRSRDELLRRWREQFGTRIQLRAGTSERERQVHRHIAKLGFPKPDSVDPIVQALRQSGSALF